MLELLVFLCPESVGRIEELQTLHQPVVGVGTSVESLETMANNAVCRRSSASSLSTSSTLGHIVTSTSAYGSACNGHAIGGEYQDRGHDPSTVTPNNSLVSSPYTSLDNIDQDPQEVHQSLTTTTETTSEASEAQQQQSKRKKSSITNSLSLAANTILHQITFAKKFNRRPSSGTGLGPVLPGGAMAACMPCHRDPATDAKRRASRSIDKQLMKWNKQESKVIKLLLIGKSEKKEVPVY